MKTRCMRGDTGRHQRGSTVLIILFLLGCMAMLITINTSNLHVLKQELKRIEKQQKTRLNQSR